MKRIFSILLIFSMALYFFSCEQEKEGPAFTEEEQASLNDDALFESVFNDLSQTVNSASSNPEGGRIEDNNLGCAELIVNQTDNGLAIVVDFGEECVGRDGKTRSGQVNIDVAYNAATQKNVTTTTLENYFVNGYKVEGTTITTSEGATETGFVNSVVLVNGKLTWPDGVTYATRESAHTHTWTLFQEGSLVELDITGSASGTNRNRVPYTSAINEDNPFHYNLNCLAEGAYMPTQGNSIITTDNFVIGLDFGDGACDNTAIVTIGDRSKEVNF